MLAYVTNVMFFILLFPIFNTNINHWQWDCQALTIFPKFQLWNTVSLGISRLIAIKHDAMNNNHWKVYRCDYCNVGLQKYSIRLLVIYIFLLILCIICSVVTITVTDVSIISSYTYITFGRMTKYPFYHQNRKQRNTASITYIIYYYYACIHICHTY